MRNFGLVPDHLFGGLPEVLAKTEKTRQVAPERAEEKSGARRSLSEPRKGAQKSDIFDVRLEGSPSGPSGPKTWYAFSDHKSGG